MEVFLLDGCCGHPRTVDSSSGTRNARCQNPGGNHPVRNSYRMDQSLTMSTALANTPGSSHQSLYHYWLNPLCSCDPANHWCLWSAFSSNIFNECFVRDFVAQLSPRQLRLAIPPLPRLANPGANLAISLLRSRTSTVVVCALQARILSRPQHLQPPRN